VPVSWWDSLRTKFTNTINATKSWFKNSETIFLARLESTFGFVLGGVAGIDWNALLSLDLSNLVKDTKVLYTAVALFIHGLVLEAMRRRNATDLT